MKKIKQIIIIIVFLISVLVLIFINNSKQTNNSDQIMIENTYTISKQYVLLRYQTDNILRNAKTYKDYDSWNKEMSEIISRWEQLEKDALDLENIASNFSEEKISFNMILKAQAYSKQEISDVFDKAPAGKKIKTLAKFLWVDAKKAFQILKQDQAQVEADAWNEAWNTFQNLETSATIIKDYCKVAGFVWWVIVSGWAAWFAWASTLSQAVVIVSGADLTLEVTDDAAKIALWNNNKISEIVGDARIVTEPLASILTITNIPGNLEKGIDKFSAVMVTLDQFNTAAQDWKIVWVKLPVYTKDKTKQKIEVSILEKTELESWVKEQWWNLDKETVKEIEEILENNKTENNEIETKENVETEKDNKNTSSVNNSSIEWVWEWVMKYTPSQNAKELEISISLLLNKDGSVITTSEVDWFVRWSKEWNNIKFYADINHEDGYYEFNLSWDTMIFIKLAWINSEWKWQEDLAWEDFFGWKFYTITLIKQ